MHLPTESCAICEEKARDLPCIMSLTSKIALKSHTVGPFNQKNSRAKNTRSPTAPMMSGTRTWADDHGNWIPPQVIASSIDTVLPAMMAMPL